MVGFNFTDEAKQIDVNVVFHWMVKVIMCVYIGVCVCCVYVYKNIKQLSKVPFF